MARFTSVRSLLAILVVKVLEIASDGCQESFSQWRFTGGNLHASSTKEFSFSKSSVQTSTCFVWFQQAPRVWFNKFNSTVSAFSFMSSPHDSTLFTRCSDQGMILLLLYMDDMIITGDDTKGIIELQQYLSKHFEKKDLGPLSYFLGLEVSSYDDGYIFLNQNMLLIYFLVPILLTVRIFLLPRNQMSNLPC